MHTRKGLTFVARLRTLEFWVDNLNPLFLYPEVSKQIELFAKLMQALSRHLRPAPYPYGLLTLRLLGKLGGKNRQFLRFPMELSSRSESNHAMHVECSWKHAGERAHPIKLPLPIESCVKLLRQIVRQGDKEKLRSPKRSLGTNDSEDVVRIIQSTIDDQVTACFRIILKGKSCHDKSQVLNENIFTGLLYCTMVDRLRKDAIEEIFSAMSFRQNVPLLASCLASFTASSADKALGVGSEIITRISSTFAGDHRIQVFDALVDALCDTCCSKAGTGYCGPQRLILLLVQILGPRWAERHQFKIVNATLFPVKSVPRELTHISVNVTRIFLDVCLTLYGKNYVDRGKGATLQDCDTLFNHFADHAEMVNAIHVPSDAVFRLIAKEVSSPQQLTRFVRCDDCFSSYLFGFISDLQLAFY